MKGADKGILLGFAMLGVLLAFYVMVLGPKRSKSSELSDEIATLESSISQQEQVVAGAEQARKEFPEYYGRLVVLGKAAPDQADTNSMLVQLSQIAAKAGIDFRGLSLAQSASGGGDAAAAAGGTPPPTTTAPASPESTPPPAEGAAPPAGGATPPAGGTTPAPTTDAGTATPAAATTPAPATEATAATLPIGATVGPAGLPILPYDFVFLGTYFDVASFLAKLDSQVTIQEKTGKVVSNGRLLTVDGFALSSPRMSPIGPILKVDFATTSYVAPADQGLTAGATPGGPAPAPAAPETTPASAPVATP